MARAREAVLCLLGLALVAPYSECTVFGYHNYSTDYDYYCDYYA